MAYFNHAFTKMFLGTQVSGSGAGQNPNANLDDGFLITAGLPSVTLTGSTYGVGSYGFFDPKTWLSVYPGPSGCCPLVLASASLLHSDKIGPFHGGYQETNKSKMINPKYVQQWYRVDPCTPQQSVVSIGNTVYTSGDALTLTIGGGGGSGYTNGTYTNVPMTGGTGAGLTADVTISGGAVTAITIVNAGGGYSTSDTVSPDTAYIPYTAGSPAAITIATVGDVDPKCCYEFLCGETYYLRIDIKGSPALRYLNHNAYQNLAAYTGCCPGATPTVVDSTLVMIAWAEALMINAYLTPFVLPVVFDETGVAWYPPNTTVDPSTGNAVIPSQWWTAYVSTGHTPGACAGLRLFGAYVDTKFGNCSFQITDFFEKEPVKVLASLVDLNGDPCVFEGICVVQECIGLQGMGFGEQVVRDLILAESYLQNFFATDIRIREITQGFDILNSVNRNALYTRYFLLHSVPRYNNPTGVFDNDRYMLEIISTAANTTLETFVSDWLDGCPDCVDFTVDACTPCTIVPNP